MNKISLYIFLILIFLGLSKSFSPSIQGVLYINDERDFPNYFHEQPISILLLDSFETGFLIRTYFQKYQIVHGFKPPEQILVKTSKEYWLKSNKYIGMSLFRRNEVDGKESLIPMPPGVLFAGDPSFGYWFNEDSGRKIWKFHNAYKHFPKILFWENFKFSREFHKKAYIFESNSKPFFGLKNEFGTEGHITKTNVVGKYAQTTNETISYMKHFRQFLTLYSKRNKSSIGDKK